MVPPLFVVAFRWVVVDADLVIDVAVQVGVDVWLQDVLQHPQLRDFLRSEAVRVVEDLAVTISEDVGGEPTVDTQHPRLETGGDHCLHEGLTRLEVLTGDRHALLRRQLDHCRYVDGQIRCAIGEGHTHLETGVCVDL